MDGLRGATTDLVATVVVHSSFDVGCFESGMWFRKRTAYLSIYRGRERSAEHSVKSIEASRKANRTRRMER
jgi:hypothetical protein